MQLPTLKTPKRIQIEERDLRVYTDWIEMTKNPESQRTAITEHLQVKHGLKHSREVYRMVNRAKSRIGQI